MSVSASSSHALSGIILGSLRLMIWRLMISYQKRSACLDVIGIIVTAGCWGGLLAIGLWAVSDRGGTRPVHCVLLFAPCIRPIQCLNCRRGWGNWTPQLFSEPPLTLSNYVQKGQPYEHKNNDYIYSAQTDRTRIPTACACIWWVLVS